ncbi:MAG TPA: hypothetical protein VGS20_08605 [Candidatus Acidoferrales bacterium]|nr:hypothetical protein [Candidatus Acidoferrales bacterium]
MNGETNASCLNEQIRRDLVGKRAGVNGIDYVEVDPADHSLLYVHFLKPVPPLDPANPNDPNDGYGLSTNPANITITGGTRVVGIQPVKAARDPSGFITITVDPPGDYSTYTLTLNVPELDRVLRQVDFSFMAACAVDFDCRQIQVCPPPPLAGPLLDYQAKDYASFRRLMLDLLPQLNPQFLERNPADLGIALIELLAYAGDRLSYFQDAAANEAYLDTARQRISARRLAKLVDYRMHDGRNAWTYVHVAIDPSVAGPVSLPQGAKVLTRIFRPLAGESSPPQVVVDPSKITADTLESDPALASVAVFETTHPAQLDRRNNQIFIHTWGDERCCLRPGATDAFLYITVTGVADLPVLNQGDYLLFEEVMGPLTGIAADADRAHRQVVQIDQPPQPDSDPLFSNTLVNGLPQPWTAGPTLPLLHVHWRLADQLTYPFCLSAQITGGVILRNVSVARGNLVLADHGLTTSESIPLGAPVPADAIFRPRLSHGPLTIECRPSLVTYDSATGLLQTPRTNLTCDVRQAQPAIALLVGFPAGQELWTPAADLLESTPFDENFVAEIDNDDLAVLRFGDGEYGREIAGATSIEAVYRIGNGLAGNVGAETMAHLAPQPAVSGVLFIRNPLAAVAGVDLESIEQVRQDAPAAFHAVQYRAVTEADYANAALLLPRVASAVASFRWTGSWHTVFVGVLPSDPADLVNEAKGLTSLSPTLASEVAAFLTSYRQTGYDLEIRPPQFVALEIDLLVCAACGYFRADVEQAVLAALSNRLLPAGGKGLFYTGNFKFGQPVYLSQVYAAVDRVEGVDSVVVTAFHQFGQPDNGELAKGVFPIGPWQIARLDNDPNFMERGVLKVTLRGGKL